MKIQFHLSRKSRKCFMSCCLSVTSCGLGPGFSSGLGPVFAGLGPGFSSGLGPVFAELGSVFSAEPGPAIKRLTSYQWMSAAKQFGGLTLQKQESHKAALID